MTMMSIGTNCVFEGSMLLHGLGFERRPYHRYCGCALHQSRGNICSNNCRCLSRRRVLFRWKNKSISLSLTAMKISTSLNCDMLIGRRKQIVQLYNFVDTNSNQDYDIHEELFVNMYNMIRLSYIYVFFFGEIVIPYT